MKERGLVFGQKCIESLAKYDQDLQSLRTFQCSLLGAEHELLTILPKSAMMLNGKLFLQSKLELGIKEKESGLLPTPTASDYKGWSAGHKRANDPTNRLDFAIESVNKVGGTLNPEFVEWLMGFPIGWTDLKDSETQ